MPALAGRIGKAVALAILFAGGVVALDGAAQDKTAPPSIARGDICVLLLHGKLGAPDGFVRPLGEALSEAGFRVEAPVMAWANTRRFDRTIAESMQEIADHLARFRAQGCAKTVIAGHSLGGAAALRFGASGSGHDAIILVAPGFSPENKHFQTVIASAVRQAEAAIAEGRGDALAEYADFGDDGQRRPLMSRAKPWLDWHGQQSDIAMGWNARTFREGVPVLWLPASGDHPYQLSMGASHFRMLPAHPLSRYMQVQSSHGGAPQAAIAEVTAWLDRLRE